MAAVGGADEAPQTAMTGPFLNGDGARDRATLKRELFRFWDKDSDGALKKAELLQLARATGFDGTETEWDAEYPEMCKEKGCTPEAGLPEAAVMALLDDDSDVGCYFTDEELVEIMREATAGGTPHSPFPASPAPVAGASPEPAASPDADEPMLPANGANRDEEVPAGREELKSRLFALWDKDADGFLKQDELLVLARATGFDGTVEEWAAEYPEMCAEKGCKPEEGISRSAVMALLDDDSDNGCYFSDEELREILAEAGTGTGDGGVQAGGSSSSTSAAGPPPLLKDDRQALKRKLFRLWDQDKDGFLKVDEMVQVALATGFDGTDEEWAAEYQAMCEERKVRPEAGFSKAMILDLLDDQSEQGAFVPTDEIKRLVEVLAGSEPDPEREMEFQVKVTRDAQGKAGFSVRQADLLITNLTKSKELHPMENGDVVTHVNGEAIDCFAEYMKKAHGEKEFTLTVKKPREFEDSEKWVGQKPGYVFKIGNHGLGYYRNVYNGVFGVMTGEQEFHPWPRFQGQWGGHVFKMGHLGLGYYVDTVSRIYLKRRLFELWDTNKDGRLSKQEACQFAHDTGFSGEFKEFEKAYEQMCATKSCDPARGLSQSAVYELLDDRTDRGCFISSEDMHGLIEKIEQAISGGKARAAPISETVPLADIPIARLKALAKLHGVSLAGCCEKSEIVEALKKAGVADQGAAAVAAAAEKHQGDAKDQAAAEERGAFQRKIMLCDEKGELKRNSVAKMAQCVGWIGDDGKWVDAFSKVFKSQGCSVKEESRLRSRAVRGACERDEEELTVATVMAVAEATKSQLLEKAVGSSDTGDGNPAKKRKVLPPVKAPGAVAVKKCEACEKEPKEDAHVFCQNCKAFLCAKCNEDNHTTNLLKKHIRVSCNKSATGLPVGAPLPVGKMFKSLNNMAVAELKALAKKHCIDVTACVEKKDIVAVLEKNDVKVELVVEEEKPKAAEAPKKVTPPPAKKAAPEKPGEIRPKPKTKEEEAERLQEVYFEHRERLSPGSQWALKTGVALWRNDVGWERTLFINAKTPSGWPSVIEVLEYGSRRLKVRGMGVDRTTGQMVGNRWQMGWLELAMLVDKDTGELLCEPNTQTGQVCQPRPKAGTGVKVLPKSHPMSKESQKAKEAETKDPEAGEKPQGMAQADVFKKPEDL